MAADRVPDGPPVRRETCDRTCDTRWDREPTHSERCDREHERIGREVNARLEESLRKAKDGMDRYLAYRRAARGEL